MREEKVIGVNVKGLVRLYGIFVWIRKNLFFLGEELGKDVFFGWM